MSILAWIILGALAGWIASKLMGEDDNMGWFGNIVVGIAGAILGGWAAGGLGIAEDNVDFDLGSLVLAILGACALLWVVRLITKTNRNV